ncbi:hypothetical protein KAR91_66520 [Candidatus Pacearchaeota archaeon]|nr:hypothetical protein [Candidatus Pacearchaeota archaeon]
MRTYMATRKELEEIFPMDKRERSPVERGVIFQLGKPVPKVWLHMEFNWDDTMKYRNDALIETEDELKRLIEKYLS